MTIRGESLPLGRMALLARYPYVSFRAVPN
jgi:hypothetical protein